MVIRLGIIGFSEGNGHPYSFSSIINGFDENSMTKAGWKIIGDYLRCRHESEFHFEGVEVSHAWTQDPYQTQLLCEACLISNQVSNYVDLIGKVNGVIIARDDYLNHFEIALPFLKAGCFVFVDKPLSLDPNELRDLLPYINNGKLMSCSGMRFCKELDVTRSNMGIFGKVCLIRGTVLNDWERYGIHLLDAVFGLMPNARPVWVSAIQASHDSMAIEMDNDILIQIDALGAVPKLFRVDIFGSDRSESFDILDNFSMFRRMLWQFAKMCRTSNPPIPPQNTIDAMKVLIAGRQSKNQKRRIAIDDFQL